MLKQRMRIRIQWLLILLLFAAGASARAAADDADVTRGVQRALSSLDYGSNRPTVSVSSGVAMVSGTIATLWLKEETISRTRKVPGVTSLVLELTIPRAESDEKLVKDVTDKIQHYERFTVYDDFQGSVKNGVVYLGGAVTEPKKLEDVIERVSKIRGVQAIDNKVVVLPPNQSDDRLRVAIATAIYRNPDFERYSMTNPPIHVIVNNGHVTLIGYVRNEIEKRKAHEAAQFINGVLALDDRVKVVK